MTRTSAAGAFTIRRLIGPLIWLLLVVGFFLGPVKLLGAAWFGYLSADALALLILVVLAGDLIAARRPLLITTPLTVPLVALAAYCVLELANPNAPILRSVLGLRSWLLYLSFYFVGWHYLRSVRQLKRLYALLVALGALTAAYGIYQWRAGPESFAGWSELYGRYARLAWSTHSGSVFRAFSTFTAAGTFGGNMALLMLLAFGVIASPRMRILPRALAAGAFAIMGAGIAVSGSRGAVAQLLLAATVVLAFIPGVRSQLSVGVMAPVLGAMAVTVVVLLVGPAVSERFSTIFDPQAFFWKWFGPLTGGVQVALEHPFGMGLGYTAGVPQFVAGDLFRDLPTTNVDSGYGSAAAELGLLGLMLFAYFAAKVGIQGARVWRRLPQGTCRDLLLGPALFAATYPIVSVVFQPQATLPSSAYFWLLIGMLMKAPAFSQSHDANQLLRTEVQPRE